MNLREALEQISKSGSCEKPVIYDESTRERLSLEGLIKSNNLDAFEAVDCSYNDMFCNYEIRVRRK